VVGSRWPRRSIRPTHNRVASGDSPGLTGASKAAATNLQASRETRRLVSLVGLARLQSRQQCAAAVVLAPEGLDGQQLQTVPDGSHSRGRTGPERPCSVGHSRRWHSPFAQPHRNKGQYQQPQGQERGTSRRLGGRDDALWGIGDQL